MKPCYHAVIGISVGLVLVSTAIAGEPLGLVLSGGGAKGAYEVGVWKELSATGMAKDIVAISGTSIGAVNAALFSSVSIPDEIKRIWLDQVGGILSVNKEFLASFGTQAERDHEAALMRQNIAQDLALAAKRRKVSVAELPIDVVHSIESRCQSVSAKKLLLRHGKEALWKSVSSLIKDGRADGLLDSRQLFHVLMSQLPESWDENAPASYAMALKKMDGGEFLPEVFHLNETTSVVRASMICASAAIPIAFGTFDVDGVPYVDGGWEGKGGDNVPIGPILENHPDIKTVIVVHLSDAANLSVARRDRVRAAATAAGVRLVEIVPSEDIGGVFGWQGVFDASPETAKHLIELGRKDAREKLREAGLAD